MDEVLTPTALSKALSISTETLRRWRKGNRGPAWFRIGDDDDSPVRYRMSDVHAWMDGRKKKARR